MAVCAYHPDRPAADRCTECQRDLCAACRTEVAGKPVCTHCVELIRSKVAAEMAAGTPSAGASPYGQAPGNSAPAATMPYGGAPSAAATMPNVIVQEPPSPARLLVGIALGALFGAVGGFIWKTVSYYGHFEVAYLNIIVGCAAGYGVVKGSGRQGLLQGILGALLGFGAMMFGYYLLMNAEFHDQAREFLAKLAASAGAKAPVAPQLPTLSFADFIDGLKALSVIDWAFVAAGVYGGFIVGKSSAPKAQS